MSVEPKSSPSKPFSEMTEEEKIEWAKTHKAIPRTVVTDRALAASGKDKAKRRVANAKKLAKYYDPEKRKKRWGEEYNAKLRYLYQHNEEFRELKKYRVQLRTFKKRRHEYDAWVHRYYNVYKDRMTDNASIFKLEGTENYVNGFTLKDLAKFSPTSPQLLQSFLRDNLFPAPKYRGYKHKNNKLAGTAEDFYLVSEVESFLNVFAKYKKKFSLVRTDEQKLYLKKQFWASMTKAREEFDND